MSRELEGNEWLPDQHFQQSTNCPPTTLQGHECWARYGSGEGHAESALLQARGVWVGKVDTFITEVVKNGTTWASRPLVEDCISRAGAIRKVPKTCGAYTAVMR